MNVVIDACLGLGCGLQALDAAHGPMMHDPGMAPVGSDRLDKSRLRWATVEESGGSCRRSRCDVTLLHSNKDGGNLDYRLAAVHNGLATSSELVTNRVDA